MAPRLRGSSAFVDASEIDPIVGPAPAGILPPHGPHGAPSGGWPRACGDPPSTPTPEREPALLAPRLRGSSGIDRHTET
ncbi:hypothetical protein STTU_p0102 (plasmid) [Streptomyces sp. Tu6071]|nr:hypothetical protein STTU_p0102 [Streptomyces sp. Tu6071]